MTLLFFFSLLATALWPQQAAVIDDFGTPFALTAAPQRIVSLAPNITEILFALGLGDRVVGVTRYCDYPPEALQKEKIGGMVDPNLEMIQSLRPDLVIAFRGNPLGVLNKLRSLHFPVFVLNLGSTIDGLFQTIGKVGRVTGAEKAARAVTAGLEEKRRAILLALRDVSRKPKVFLSVYGQGLWTSGQDSYLNDLLVQAGGMNIARQIDRRWLQLNREQFVHEDPDIIIIMARDRDSFARAAAAFRADPRFKDVRAVRYNDIHWLDENMAGRFGPRLIDALAATARLLHPEKFEARR